MELLCSNAAKHTVLIQLLEDGIQFGFLLPHGGQFFLLPANFTLDLGGLLAANIGGKFFWTFPCHGRYPPQILQHHLIQNALPNIVACAGFSILLVGATCEMVVAGRHGTCPVQHHIGAAVGAEHKTGILILFFHLRRAASVLPHPLHDVPDLLGNESGMGVLKHQTFFSGMFHPSLILIGLGAVFHVDGIAQINLVFQKISNGTVRPVIWMCGVQTGMIHAIPGIGVHVGRQHLFFFQDSGDLAGAVAAGAHGEYPADDGHCFIIYRQLLCFRILDVAHKALWSPAVLHAPPWLSAPPGSSGWYLE